MTRAESNTNHVKWTNQIQFTVAEFATQFHYGSPADCLRDFAPHPTKDKVGGSEYPGGKENVHVTRTVPRHPGNTKPEARTGTMMIHRETPPSSPK